jgi:hypothetical protein
LFDRAVVWLANDRVLLPGIMTLARMVAAVRSEENDRLRAVLYETVPYELRTEMVRLLEVPEKKRVPELERLRLGPMRVSGKVMELALERICEVGDLGAGAVDAGQVPAARPEDWPRATGRWLEVNGESVYGTTYWSRMADLGELRLTVKQNHASCITSLTDPGSSLAAGAPVPIRKGDKVTMLGSWPAVGLAGRPRRADRAGTQGGAGGREVRLGVQGQSGWLTAATMAHSPLRAARHRHSSTSATSRHHPAASRRVLAGQQGGQPAQVLQFLVKCRREGVYRDVVRTGPVLCPDALGH